MFPKIFGPHQCFKFEPRVFEMRKFANYEWKKCAKYRRFSTSKIKNKNPINFVRLLSVVISNHVVFKWEVSTLGPTRHFVLFIYWPRENKGYLFFPKCTCVPVEMGSYPKTRLIESHVSNSIYASIGQHWLDEEWQQYDTEYFEFRKGSRKYKFLFVLKRRIIKNVGVCEFTWIRWVWLRI